MSEYRSIIERAFKKLYAEFSRIRSDPKLADVVGRGESGDITHTIDAMAEKLLIESFRRSIPNCTVVSEEIGIVDGAKDAPIVLMDPIDGSTNAIRGLPVFCATAGILEDRKFGSMEASGTVDLVTGEIIVGDGRGVYVNGEKHNLSKVSKLEEALVSYEVKVRVERPQKMIDKMYELMSKTKYPRVLGSAALEIAYVAIGRMDAYVAPGKQLRSYDCLPSIFLVKSARGFVQGIGQNLDSVDVMSNERISFVVAGNKTLGKIFAEEFSSV
ncbi:MAG: inositol monophosphatase [Thaumarchaeota archaeon]|nr:inositol monophosphatase [Nitrososphaerota archaeon]